jgi:hypothetical protein
MAGGWVIRINHRELNVLREKADHADTEAWASAPRAYL